MDDWEPSDSSPVGFASINMGGIDEYGEYTPSPFARTRHDNLLMHGTSDPVILRLGEFISAAPHEMAAIGAMGGVLLGIRLAQLDPLAAQRVLDHVDRIAHGMTPLEDTVQSILHDTD